MDVEVCGFSFFVTCGRAYTLRSAQEDLCPFPSIPCKTAAQAGCKTVIGSRLKRSGRFWTVRGANAILALRCCFLSKKFEDYWESRPRAA